jgi:hypothetical protein
MNEIKAADVNTGYGARGVPAFTCRFVSKTVMKWQKLAIQGGNNQKTHQPLKKPAYETRVSFMRWLFSQQNLVVLCF